MISDGTRSQSTKAVGPLRARNGALLLVGLLWTSACSFPDFTFEADSQGGGGSPGGKGGSGGTSAEGGVAGALLGGSGGVSSASKETDCSNGIDDDRNGKTDCEDAECAGQGYTVVDPFDNAKWKGPVAFWVGASSDSIPSCDGLSGYESALGGPVYGELNNKSTSCEPCGACSYDRNLANPQIDVGAYVDTGSGSGCRTYASPTSHWTLDSTCKTIRLSTQDKDPALVVSTSSGTCTVGWVAKNVTVSGGASPAEPHVPEQISTPAYSRIGQLCGSGASSTVSPIGNSMCALGADANKGFHTCIYTEEDAATCPKGWLTWQYESYFRRIYDDRSCAACTCKCNWNNPISPNSIPYGAISVQLSRENDNCAFNSFSIPIEGCSTGNKEKCSPGEGTVHSIKATFNSLDFLGTPSCAFEGGEGQGQVKGDSPLTICCRDDVNTSVGTNGTGS